MKKYTRKTMKRLGMKLAVTLGLGLVFSGCASSGVVPLDSGVYYISKQEYAAFGPPSGKTIQETYNEANSFCAKKGKIVKSINRTLHPTALGENARIDLEFMCVEK